MSRENKKKRNGSEYDNFENALRKILSVPHSRIKSKLDAEKRKRTKHASASHVATAKA